MKAVEQALHSAGTLKLIFGKDTLTSKFDLQRHSNWPNPVNTYTTSRLRVNYLCLLLLITVNK